MDFNALAADGNEISTLGATGNWRRRCGPRALDDAQAHRAKGWARLHRPPPLQRRERGGAGSRVAFIAVGIGISRGPAVVDTGT